MIPATKLLAFTALISCSGVRGQLEQIPFLNQFPFLGQFPIQGQYPIQGHYPFQSQYPIPLQYPIGVPVPFQEPVLQATLPAATCRYWCRSPGPVRQFYCCPVGGKPGTCPQISREVCAHYMPRIDVVICTFDYDCAETDKCCFDPCLDKNTCQVAVMPLPELQHSVITTGQ